MVACQLLTWTQPRQMVSSGSLGTMGVGIGFSLGAQLAAPLAATGPKGQINDVSILIDGDGSFNMTSTDLKTLAELNSPVKVMVLDNKSAMMVEYWQKVGGGGLAEDWASRHDGGVLAEGWASRCYRR